MAISIFMAQCEAVRWRVPAAIAMRKFFVPTWRRSWSPSAGVYWLSDNIPAEFSGKAARLRLADNALTVQTVELIPF
ncbi:Septum site-determining protein MinC [Leclercia adecarboxylata]|uniref:Septum site-determining protein MinC n=1 Tax=Leclercia adecarboxylata TaxID=83655 RepID=A0A4U9HZC7_9ENTR|nr:Septum site-determining protein MinC [Leclercia adecarboxylata]